jgi:hypothetical protein
MIAIEVPGFGRLGLARLALDYDRTLARDSWLLPGAVDVLHDWAGRVRIHVVTTTPLGLRERSSRTDPARSFPS